MYQLTISFCIKEHKPYVLIDTEAIAIERASTKIRSFIEKHSITTLNVAGPRAGGEPRAYGYTKNAILRVAEKRPMKVTKTQRLNATIKWY